MFQVTAKTFGVVLVGLLGLLLYVGIYVDGVVQVGLANAALYVGLGLTVVMLVFILLVASLPDKIKTDD